MKAVQKVFLVVSGLAIGAYLVPLLIQNLFVFIFSVVWITACVRLDPWGAFVPLKWYSEQLTKANMIGAKVGAREANPGWWTLDSEEQLQRLIASLGYTHR